MLRRLTKRREVSSLVALTAPLDGQPARLYARHVFGTVRVPEVLAALPYFRRRIGQPVWLIWDRLNAHTARVVQAFLAAHRPDFRMTWLPPYAPELNPEELCNAVVKADLRNAVPVSVEELRRQARRSFIRLARRPALLTSFFHHAGLDVT